jgi:hypothetical protein
MSTFEYVAIAFSLVFSFAAMRIIAGLPTAIQSDRRYWVHLTFTLFHLFVIAVSFWSFLSLRDASWTLPKFLLTLASPALLFFMACTLIPDDPFTVASWSDYYYSIRKRFWIACMLFLLTGATIATVMLDAPWDHPGRVAHGLGFAVATTGAVSESERVHSALAAVVLTFAPIWTIIAFQPGYFAA